ncbi:Fes1-domain-containing protein [Gymnopus androsaceus JB14]|uniref:Fes1-domain-containing protein n=1 Tax=Gymnopus androsaceus JB14 TaxID=1447944 RepID=A0A6A4GNB5_9AGAR|nr:Fes1-domain-containing protein [Gymnopus androsaceus JB14]
MQSLLRWGIENSTPQDANTNAPPPTRRSDLNPEIIDLLLGKSDAELMKEAMAIAVDANRSEDDRIDALDNLEMVNLEKLNLWEPLHALLTSGPDSVKAHAVWVIGTALQNNPAAQDAYLKLEPLPTLTSFLSPSSGNSAASSQQIRSKLDSDGWSRLCQALQDPNITVRRKTAFLLNSLLTPNETTTSSSASPIHPNSHAAHLFQPGRASTSALTLEAMTKHNILGTLIDGLTNPLPYGEDGDKEEVDPDFEEKVLREFVCLSILSDFLRQQRPKDRLREWIGKEKMKDSSGLAERWSVSGGELDELVQRVKS